MKGVDSQKVSEAMGRTDLDNTNELQLKYLSQSEDTQSTPAGTTQIDYGNMVLGSSASQYRVGSEALLEGLASGISQGAQEFVKWGEFAGRRDMDELNKGMESIRASGGDRRAQLDWLNSQNYTPTIFNQDAYASLKNNLAGTVYYEDWQKATTEEMIDLQSNEASKYRAQYGYKVGGGPLSAGAMVTVMNQKLSQEADSTKKAWLMDKMVGYQGQMQKEIQANAMATFSDQVDTNAAILTEQYDTQQTVTDPNLEAADFENSLHQLLNLKDVQDPMVKADIARMIKRKAADFRKHRAGQSEDIIQAAKATQGVQIISNTPNMGPDELPTAINNLAPFIDPTNYKRSAEMIGAFTQNIRPPHQLVGIEQRKAYIKQHGDALVDAIRNNNGTPIPDSMKAGLKAAVEMEATNAAYASVAEDVDMSLKAGVEAVQVQSENPNSAAARNGMVNSINKTLLDVSTALGEGPNATIFGLPIPSTKSGEVSDFIFKLADKAQTMGPQDRKLAMGVITKISDLQQRAKQASGYRTSGASGEASGNVSDMFKRDPDIGKYNHPVFGPVFPTDRQSLLAVDEGLKRKSGDMMYKGYLAAAQDSGFNLFLGPIEDGPLFDLGQKLLHNPEKVSYQEVKDAQHADLAMRIQRSTDSPEDKQAAMELLAEYMYRENMTTAQNFSNGLYKKFQDNNNTTNGENGNLSDSYIAKIYDAINPNTMTEDMVANVAHKFDELGIDYVKVLSYGGSDGGPATPVDIWDVINRLPNPNIDDPNDPKDQENIMNLGGILGNQESMLVFNNPKLSRYPTKFPASVRASAKAWDETQDMIRAMESVPGFDPKNQAYLDEKKKAIFLRNYLTRFSQGVSESRSVAAKENDKETWNIMAVAQLSAVKLNSDTTANAVMAMDPSSLSLRTQMDSKLANAKNSVSTGSATNPKFAENQAVIQIISQETGMQDTDVMEILSDITGSHSYEFISSAAKPAAYFSDLDDRQFQAFKDAARMMGANPVLNGSPDKKNNFMALYRLYGGTETNTVRGINPDSRIGFPVVPSKSFLSDLGVDPTGLNSDAQGINALLASPTVNMTNDAISAVADQYERELSGFGRGQAIVNTGLAPAELLRELPPEFGPFAESPGMFNNTSGPLIVSPYGQSPRTYGSLTDTQIDLNRFPEWDKQDPYYKRIGEAKTPDFDLKGAFIRAFNKTNSGRHQIWKAINAEYKLSPQALTSMMDSYYKGSEPDGIVFTNSKGQDVLPSKNDIKDLIDKGIVPAGIKGDTTIYSTSISQSPIRRMDTLTNSVIKITYVTGKTAYIMKPNDINSYTRR
jgi:hypothetical protein